MSEARSRRSSNEERSPSEQEDVDWEADRARAEVRRRVVWRKSKGTAAQAAVPESSGQPLPGHVRTRMEPLLGGNLSGVRVHTGGESAQAAEGLGARAFTTGNDVHFGAGEFAPGSKEGDKLLAHELTHVVQGQRASVQRKAAPGAQTEEDAEGHEGGVSKPHDPAEVEADAAAEHVAGALHGDGKEGDEKPKAGTDAKAAPAPISAKYIGTPRIYRAKSATVAQPAAGGGAKDAAKADAAGGAKGAAAPSGAPADPLQPLRDAIDAKSRGQAAMAWSKLAAADHKKVTQADILAALDVSPATSFQMMKSIGADFATAAYATKFLSIPKPEIWMADMATYGLWDSFVTSSPKHEELTKPQRDALGGFVSGAKARPVFEKVYPKLHDTTYAATYLKSTKWGDADIQRLYHAFDGLPVAHVQASAGGFFLGTDENLSGKGFQPLGFAWQQGDKMVLPKASSNASGGGTGHDMTGGAKSGATKDVAGSAGGGPQQSHFVGSATHEVGHAVSNAVGGDAWSTTRNGFTPIALDAWSKALFDDAAVDAAIKSSIKAGKLTAATAIAPATVRTYLANKIQGKTILPTGVTEANITKFAANFCNIQPLYKYQMQLQTAGPGNDYQLPATNIIGGKAYAFLSRFNNQTCSYNADTYNKRVSWYSVSSPAEWFAENYSHYYRMEGKHPEADAEGLFRQSGQVQMDAGGRERNVGGWWRRRSWRCGRAITCRSWSQGRQRWSWKWRSGRRSFASGRRKGARRGWWRRPAECGRRKSSNR